YVLLVEARLRAARRVAVPRPEARRVRGERLVDPHQLLSTHPELELRVCEDDPSLLGVRSRLLVDPQAEVADLRRAVRPDRPRHRLERDVLVVAALRLRGGREDRRVEAIGLPQTRGQPDAAERARGAVLLP